MAISTTNMSKSLFGKLLVVIMLLLMVVMTVASREMALAGEGARDLDMLGSACTKSCREMCNTMPIPRWAHQLCYETCKWACFSRVNKFQTP